MNLERGNLKKHKKKTRLWTCPKTDHIRFINYNLLFHHDNIFDVMSWTWPTISIIFWTFRLISFPTFNRSCYTTKIERTIWKKQIKKHNLLSFKNITKNGFFQRLTEVPKPLRKKKSKKITKITNFAGIHIGILKLKQQSCEVNDKKLLLNFTKHKRITNGGRRKV